VFLVKYEHYSLCVQIKGRTVLNVEDCESYIDIPSLEICGAY
jgi:hypothetical protein